MASQKKQSEGIALLSMYNDEEDDEMQDAGEDEEGGMERGEQPEDGRGAGFEDEDLVAHTDRMVVADSVNKPTPPGANDYGSTPKKSKVGTLTPQQPSVNMLVSSQDQRVRSSDLRKSRGTLAIVDYGHDEVALSPEPEEGEIDRNGRVMFGNELQSANGDLLDRTPSGTVQVLTPSNEANTPQFSEPMKFDTMNDDGMIGSDGAEHGEGVQEEQTSIDPLDKFLPPPPKDKCSEELQNKIINFLRLKKRGKSFNAEVRNKKAYRNPDFLLHAVRYQDIDQIGSCFSKDVFDPHGYDPSDFYDEIEADMRRESDRKEQHKKKAQKVDFVSGAMQPGILAGAARINMPVSGSSAVTSSGQHLVPSADDAINREGRHNKNSKWDKVDGDQKIPLPSVGQDSVSTVGAHVAMLSAANAGGGYMLFAQQKRREAEEKRSSERKLERRL